MINVLSLFDGMSCGQIALNKAWIRYKYFASEIDKYGQQVSKYNFPNTTYLGDVRNIDYLSLPKIDLLIGGSPCQSFSFAGKRKGMSTKDNIKILSLDQYLNLKKEGFEFEGQSYLFWEYINALSILKPKYYLLENVLMSKEWEVVISKTLGIRPIMINSSLVSAQNRRRLYWTNIGTVKSGLFGDTEPGIKQPKDKGIYLGDIVELEVDKKYFLSEKAVEGLNKSQSTKLHIDKVNTLCAGTHGYANGYIYGAAMRGRNPENPKSRKVGEKTKQMIEVNESGKSNCITTVNKDSLIITQSLQTHNNIRRLTPIECERLQTVKDNYTKYGIDHKTNETVNIYDTQRYKMLGNGWTVDVIAHIFKYIEL